MVDVEMKVEMMFAKAVGGERESLLKMKMVGLSGNATSWTKQYHLNLILNFNKFKWQCLQLQLQNQLI